jgi:hypothetical protein
MPFLVVPTLRLKNIKFPLSSANQNVDDFARAVVKAMADQNSQIGV